MFGNNETGMVSPPKNEASKLRDASNSKIEAVRGHLMNVYDTMPSNANERALMIEINAKIYQLVSLIKNQQLDEDEIPNCFRASPDGCSVGFPIDPDTGRCPEFESMYEFGIHACGSCVNWRWSEDAF
jgi:hypothetical protein